MNSPRPSSDLAAVSTWWNGLAGNGFFVLPPPTRRRFTQADGHEEAALLLAARGGRGGTTNDTTRPASFAYWHWDAHRNAFDRSGTLTGELLLHWGGDHATVAAGLGEGPPGFGIVDGGPRSAFRLDRITHRDDDGLPDPSDPDGVRQFLSMLGEPVDRAAPRLTYRPLSPAEAAWLHARLDEAPDVSAAARFAIPLEQRDELTADETERLLHAWQAEYAGRLTEWNAGSAVLHALLRHGHAAAWDIVAVYGLRAYGVLSDVPTAQGLRVVREAALAGDRGAVRAWLSLHRSLHEPDAVRAASALAAELTAHGASESSLRGLYEALIGAAVTDRRRDTGAGPGSVDLHAGLAAVRFSTDERLPHALRVLAAAAARDRAELVREEALRPGSALLTGTEQSEALAALDRYEAARDALLSATGPDLDTYEGALCAVWHHYRTLTDADAHWLRERVADPGTGLQGLGFCLELLHSHGLAGRHEIEALLPHRLKDLTKKYETTYTEWRHPLVTLTCLALDLDHPEAGRLVSWWNRARPVWKDKLRLLTHLGAPDETKAAELWDFVTSSAHDVGQLTTYVLVRARLDGEHPLLVADRLIGTPGIRDRVLHRVLLGVADPAQPLWHYAVKSSSRSWWQRAREVAEDTRLSSEGRAIGLRAARDHALIRYPDRLKPPPSEAERAEALAWLTGHGES
ncbi:hypothetical protein [Streptomyces althioticus]|uniref:hypothetical protein n=1 Tax=Streptomyces althioticus TaxID=83380 RepID=UPI0033AFDB98